MQHADLKPLKELMGLLSQPPRLNLIKAIAEGSAPPDVLARRVDMLPYEIDNHLQVLHENGVLRLEDEDYSLSPRIQIATTGTHHILQFRVADDAASLMLTLNRHID
jgi:DNA-binding IclR family transcriptional regulator